MQRENFSILIVNDLESARYSLARSFRAAGYKTMEAASGSEALEFAEYVSAVVLDLHLPDLFGWEVCRLLRARIATAHLPIIHTTVRYTSDDDKAQSVACGADGFFAGFVDPLLLIEAIDRLLLQ